MFKNINTKPNPLYTKIRFLQCINDMFYFYILKSILVKDLPIINRLNQNKLFFGLTKLFKV